MSRSPARSATPSKPAPAFAPEPMSPALQRVLLTACDVAVTLDAQGRVVHVLARDKLLDEALRAAWPGQLLGDTVDSSSRGKLLALLQATDRGEPPAARHVNHPWPGQPAVQLPVLYNATHYPASGIGDGPRWLLTGRDLRDTLALQQRLVDAQQSLERDHWRFREAETRFRNLFHGSAEAVLLADGSLKVLEANPAALAMLDALRPRRGRQASGTGVAGQGTAGAPGLQIAGVPLLSLLAPSSADAVAASAASARSLGRQERVGATLSDGITAVSLSISSYEQDGAACLLVRLLPLQGDRQGADKAQTLGAEGSTGPLDPAAAAAALAQAYLKTAADALVFTDASGRIVRANRAFARLAQLNHESQAEGEPLDNWLGRSGVEMQVLLANLRDGGTPGLLATELRGAVGLHTPVEVAASALMPTPGSGGGGPVPRYAFSLRDTGRRLAPGEDALPRVPSSVKQLSELVGRVPLKQIVAETSDLIEKLSIEAALQMTRDNRALAAQMLGLSRQSLYVKLRRFGMGGLGGDPTEGGVDGADATPADPSPTDD